MANNTADYEYVELNSIITLEPTEQNIGALLQEFRLEGAFTGWESFIANVRLTNALRAIPAALNLTAADALHYYYKFEATGAF